MNLSDLIVSYIRTLVPLGVGAGLTFLGRYFEIVEPPAETVVWLVGAVTAAYYALARYLETLHPVFGLLLGSRKQPAYSKGQ